MIAGALPGSWGRPGAFPALQYMGLASNNLTGTLPEGWAASGNASLTHSFPHSLHACTPEYLRSTGTERLEHKTVWCGLKVITKMLSARSIQIPACEKPSQSFDLTPAVACNSWDSAQAHGDCETKDKRPVCPCGFCTRLAQSSRAPYPLLMPIKLVADRPLHCMYSASLLLKPSYNMPTNCNQAATRRLLLCPGSFPNLSLLDLSGTFVNGTIPESWGAAEAFPSLLFLYLNHTELTGSLPAFNNSRLSIFIASNSGLNGDLTVFWSSSAPLLASLLAGNNISGDLPGNASALPSLAFLDLSSNPVEGLVPDSWLDQGQLLSHIIGLNVGQAWWAAAAQRDSNFVQDLCLQPELYKANVESQPLSRVQELLGDIFSTPGFQGAVGDRYAATTATFQDFYTQLSSVKSICSNDDAPRLLLIMWLSFGAATSLLFVVYEGLRIRRRTKAAEAAASAAAQQGKPSPSWQVPAMVRSVSTGAVVLNEGFWGIAELSMYYYDLVSAVIVLTQIWGSWPGYLLFAIFLVHFALTGAIVLYHGLQVYFNSWQGPRQHGFKFVTTVLLSAVLSPVMIPVVWLLDMIVLYRELRHFAVKHIFAHCCKHRSSRKLTRWPSSNGEDWSVLSILKLGWLDLEYYEDMHTLGAAFFQTIPTIVLNSIIFRLGNKPSHGEYFSRSLFVSCMIAAYLSMFKSLVTIVWHAYFKGSHAFAYAGHVMIGRFLIRQQNAQGSGSSSSGALQLSDPPDSRPYIPARSSSTQLMLQGSTSLPVCDPAPVLPA